MTIFDMLGQSGALTVLGMGIVFSFLVILIIAVTIAGKIINKFARTQNVQPAVSSAQRTGNAGVTAAIGAAVNEYRKNK